MSDEPVILHRSEPTPVDCPIADIPTENFFMWKEYVQVGDDPPRLLTPWSDGWKYEWPMDWMFVTSEDARAAKEDVAPDEDWVLVHVQMWPISRSSLR